MGPRSILVALLFLAAPLTGCISGGNPDDDLSANDAEDMLNTAAPDGRNRLIAFEETNATEDGVGGVDHHHDYWNGRERVVIFERQAMMQPLGSSNAQGYQAQATFRPPQPLPGEDPSMIFEATEFVEFTLTNPQRHVCEGEFTYGGFFICTDNLGTSVLGDPSLDQEALPDPTGGPDGLKLRYKHAATTDWIDAGPIVWDAPVIIKITNPIQTDMPHATASVWEFQVLSPNAHDTTLKFTARAEIVRGGVDIPLWPGHPDFYRDAPARKVLSTTWGACDNGFGASACLLATGETGPIHAERLISYGTRTLFVWVNITEVQAPNPGTAPTNWFLYHRNATGEDNVTNVFDIDNRPFDKREHLFILPVDDNGMDSPYADGSRWNFELGGAFNTILLSCYGGCAEWSATYTIDVIATNEEFPPEMYDMACLQDNYCPTPQSSGRK